ncbi:hypothetical protein T484DRAFT_1867977 [Baffinella frigidus]|nr:hypothetical protein T484DRAFT_1867977 [Cryptophyta sp. CCMP2293]
MPRWEADDDDGKKTWRWPLGRGWAEMAPPSKGEKGGGGKTVIDKVLSAIRTHESPTGSSLAYLKKHLKAEYEFDNATVLLKALKKAVADGKLSQPTKSSYAIPGLEFAPPADEIVSMTDTTVEWRV